MKASSLVGHTVELLGELERSTLPPDAVVATFFRDRRYLGSHDRRFIAESYYGVLRHRRLCDHLLEQTGDVLSGVTGQGRSLLRLSAYLLAVNPSQDVKLRDIVEVVGVDENDDRLRSALVSIRTYGPSKFNDLPPGIRMSFPDWMVDRFGREYGGDALPALLQSLNKQAPLSVRVNTLKTTVEACKQRLTEEGVSPREGTLAATSLTLNRRMNAFSLKSFRDGWFEVQDEGSQFLAQVADPKPTDRVLDMCAGAGGKTLAMAAIMKNRGEIVATDVSAYRLKELRKRMRRAGAGNIRVQEDYIGRGYDERFDLVFVDAPCTGVGTIRRNPGMKWSVTPEMVAELSAKQSSILERAATHVQVGGMLLYATCSLFKEENEEVVERFMQAHPAFEPEQREIGPGRIGSSCRLDPHEHNTDGFYCAFLRRRREA